ncbi:hypothetical protein Peur_072758 [Populus x canadensis]
MKQYLLKWHCWLGGQCCGPFLLTYSPLQPCVERERGEGRGGRKSVSIAVRKDQNSPLNTPSMTQYSRVGKERVHLQKWRGGVTRVPLPKTCMARAFFCDL